MNVTYVTLINKIPNEVLPRQGASQLRLGPAAGAISRLYPIVQRQQGPPKVHRLPEGNDWYVFGIVDTDLTARNQSRILETLSFYYFRDVDHNTKQILDIGRRIITSEIAQEYYPNIQTLDNMNAFIGNHLKYIAGDVYHGMFVTYMLTEPPQVQRGSTPYVAYSQKWEKYLRDNRIAAELIREKSQQGQDILNNFKISRIDRFRQTYQPVNVPDRRNPASTPQRPTVPPETMENYAKRVNRPQLMPEKPYQPWQPKSKTKQKGNQRFNRKKSGFEGYTAPERTVHNMGLRP